VGLAVCNENGSNRKLEGSKMAGYIRKRGVRQDGSTKWQARYWDAADRTRRYEKVFRTKGEAQRWLTVQGAALVTGTHVDHRDADRPFRDVADAWRSTWVDLEPKTRAGYEQILANHLLPEFGGRKTSTITPALVQGFVNRLALTHRPGTTRNVYAALRSALNTGVRLRMLALNPCVGVRLPRIPREPMLFLDASEVRALADEITPHYRALVLSAAYLGLRAGELLALRRSDVDLLRGVVTVGRALKDVNGVLQYGPTKTHATRSVSIPKFLREELARHLSHSPPSGNTADALVFPGPRGGPLRHGNFLRRHFKPAVARALPPEKHGLRFHDLRHTCASLLIEQGAHPKAVQERLGHSSIQVTFDRYGHLLPAIDLRIVEALDATYAAAPALPSNVTALRL